MNQYHSLTVDALVYCVLGSGSIPSTGIAKEGTTSRKVGMSAASCNIVSYESFE